MVNKFAFLRGGLERVMFDEMHGLQAAGHEVAIFSAAHPMNEVSEWSEFFVPYAELGADNSLGAWERLVAAKRMFDNPEAAKRFRRLVGAFEPDVVHAHGIHRQISPSILRVTRELRIPVVQTLHDFHHICPADTLLYAGERPCEPRRCGKYWYGPAVVGRCHRRSVATSALSAAETSWARLVRAYERGVSRFISPSRFVAEKMRQGGWDMPMDVIPNAIAAESQVRPDAGNGFVYAGRIAPEKGIEYALEAARAAGIVLKVAGEGPALAALRCQFEGTPFLGRLDTDAVADLVRGARAVVVPSVWYENAPMAVLEAMAAGVPVVASHIGGIPEQIEDGVTGILVRPGDSGDLAAAMRRLEDDPVLAARLGEAARASVRERFAPPAHLVALLRCYRDAGAAA